MGLFIQSSLATVDGHVMELHLGSRRGAGRPRRRRVLLVLGIVAGLLGGVLGAAAAGDARRDAVLDDARDAFDRSAADLSAGVATALRRNTDVVASAAAFVAFSSGLTNPEFQSWFEEGSLERYPGLMGFGYIERVSHADLPGFVAEVAADPAPASTGAFNLLPPGPRPEYCLGRFRAMGAAGRAIELPPGLDMCAVPRFGRRFAQVRRTGDFLVMPLPPTREEAPAGLSALRAEVVAVSGTAFFVVAPVRAPGSPPTGPDGVSGWILAGFDGPTIMSSLPRLRPDLDINLSWRDGGGPVVIAERSVAIDGPRFQSAQELTVDGDWTMTVRRSAAGAYAAARSQQWAVTGAVAAFLALAVAFLWLLVGARNRALRLVDQKTDELQFQALHDALTSLPNRVLVLDRAEQMLSRARREDFSPVAMFIDVDNFKTINDTLGHAAGDGLLRTVAERLRSAVRDSDSVGRLGGDEFVVLADGAASPGWAEEFAQRLLDAMAEPVSFQGLGDMPLNVGLSIGIAVGDRPDADTLLRDADVALYEAKEAGKGRYVVFEPKMQLTVREKLALEMERFEAIGSDSTQEHGPAWGWGPMLGRRAGLGPRPGRRSRQAVASASVDFELSDDQLALRDAARDLLGKRSSPERVRAHVESGEPYDRGLWDAMVEQGWLGIDLPEADGGLGLGAVEVAVLAEELGRHLAPVPLLPSLLALGALARAAASGVTEAAPWVERLVAGEAVGCVAWSRSPDAVTSQETADGGWSLTGRADPTVAAPVADVAVVCTAAGLFAVDLAAGGARPSRESAMDLTSALGWLDLAATPAVRLGGDDAVAAVLDRGAVAVGAALLGGADRVLDMSSAYAKERVQFGRPIGSFQAVKHRCADMLVDVEGMRSTVYYAAWCVAAAHPDTSVAASTAKIWCSDAAQRVMASGLQVHGGIGFTWEHDLHLYMKRSQLDQVTFGDATWHRERLAALLRPKVEAGQSVI